jgi:hypothetical protein
LPDNIFASSSPIPELAPTIIACFCSISSSPCKSDYLLYTHETLLNST